MKLSEIDSVSEPTTKRMKLSEISDVQKAPEEPSTFSDVLTGAKTAIMEPVYGLGEFLPQEYGGKASAQAAKKLETEYQQAVERSFYATRAGYLPTMLGTFFVPGGAAKALGYGGKAAEALTAGGRIGEAVTSGAKTGAAYGAAYPTGEEDFSERMKSKAVQAAETGVLGAATGGVLGGGSEALSKLGITKDYFDLLKGKVSKEEISKLSEALKSGKIEQEIIPQRGVKPEDLQTIMNEINAAREGAAGESTFGKISSYINKLTNQRKELADKSYGLARSSMDMRTKSGDVWQESEAGRSFIDSLKSRISPTKEGMTPATVAEETEINNILRDLEGKKVQVPSSRVLDEYGNPVSPPRVDTQYSTPDVLREVLRKLRDRSNGSVQEGYAAIGQQRARDLADGLAKSLGEWDGTLAQADKIYKEQSALLHPGQTQRGKAVTKRERYDMNEFAIDPLKVPSKFFTSKQGIQQLTDLVGGNLAAVEADAEKYALSQLKGKTPEAMRKWFQNAQDAGWLGYDVLPQTTKNIQDRIYRLEYSTLRQPIVDVVQNLNSGLVKPEDLTKELRSALKGKGLPAEPVKALTKELDKIDSLANKEEEARKLAAKLSTALGIGALGGGVGAYAVGKL